MFDAGFDTVGVLDRWADQGEEPVGLIAVDQNQGAARKRPLCAWPSWPRYTGGDVRDAASFTCQEDQ